MTVKQLGNGKAGGISRRQHDAQRREIRQLNEDKFALAQRARDLEDALNRGQRQSGELIRQLQTERAALLGDREVLTRAIEALSRRLATPLPLIPGDYTLHMPTDQKAEAPRLR